MQIDHIKDMKIKGFGKVIHRIFLFVTYPIRHVFKFFAYSFVLLVALMAVPMSQGVDHKNVLQWYLNGFNDLKKELPLQTQTEKNELSAHQKADHHFKEVAAPSVVRQKIQQNEQTGRRRRAFKTSDNPNIKIVQVKDERISSRRVRRAKKSSAQSEVEFSSSNKPAVAESKFIPTVKTDLNRKSEQTIKNLSDTKAQEPDKSSSEIRSAEQVQKTDQKPILKDIRSYYRVDKSLPLVYEQTPKEITGTAFVFKPNELSVGNTYMYLYGIYTNPKKYDTQKALTYLKELADGQTLTCRIVAYTRRKIATGVCFINSMSLNQSMVDAGFADNVAL